MIANGQVSAEPSASARRRPEWPGCAPGAANGMGGLLARSHGYNGGSGAWSTHSYYHADGNGNVTMLLNARQTAVATYRYDPFGNTTYSSVSLASANTMRFSSKPVHVHSGLFEYGYRWYSSSMQRWVSRDPIWERGGMTLYAFVASQPIGYVDSYGLLLDTMPAVEVGTGVVVKVGAGVGACGATVGAVAAGGVVDAALVGYDLHLANQINQQLCDAGEAEERIQEGEAELWRRRPSIKDPQRRGYYTCLAKCNVHPASYTAPATKEPCPAPPESACPGGTEGWGTAKLETVAGKRATGNARKAIRGRLGCYTRHCHVIRCWRS